MSDPIDCTTKFSGDYYGLGVRLGIYFTWITSYLANTFVTEEISGALDANTMFLLALLSSIFNATARGELANIDALILMQLSAGYLFGSLSVWGYRTKWYRDRGPGGISQFGGLGTHCRLALAMAISVYGIWFWITGVETGLIKVTGTPDLEDTIPRPGCQNLVTFFFAGFHILGGIRIFYAIISAACAVWYGVMILAAVVERTRHFLSIFSMHEARLIGKGSTRYETGLDKKQLALLISTLRIFNLLWILFSGIMVEVTLNMNHVSHVLGPNGGIAFPAQLLPMLVGALSFVRIIWVIYQKWRWPSSEERGALMSAEEDVMQRNIGIVPRMLVSWLPWLSRFEFWTRGVMESQVRLDEGGKKDNGQAVEKQAAV